MKNDTKKEKGTWKKVVDMEDRKRRKKTYILIGVLKAGKENSGIELIFKTVIQKHISKTNRS